MTPVRWLPTGRVWGPIAMLEHEGVTYAVMLDLVSRTKAALLLHKGVVGVREQAANEILEEYDVAPGADVEEIRVALRAWVELYFNSRANA